MLELQGVSLAFGGLKVVSDLDLHVDEGEIVSVIGPNGAGKTTLFNLITGIYGPDERRHHARRAESIVGLQPHQICQRGISRTFQTLRLFLNMSVKENVMAAAYGHTKAGVFRSMLRTPGMRREEREIEAARRGAARVLRQAADGLSLGPARVLALVREPAAARDRARDRDEPAHPAARRAGGRDEPVRDARDHRADRASCATEGGYTILVIEHDMHVVEGISDRVVALDHGIKIAEGSFESVATNPQVVEAYLGLADGGDEMTTLARAGRGRHLLRPDPHPAGAVDPDRARASSSACSAATPRASRRR